jgi:TolB protein
VRAVAVLLVAIVVLGAFGGVVRAAEAGSSPGGPSADLLSSAPAWQGVGPFVFVDSLDRSHPRVVISSEGIDPSWSADGAWVAFSQYEYVGGGFRSPLSDIYIAKADGSSLTRLTFEAEVDGAASMPSWSPDGASIAYLTKTRAGIDVWTVSVAGGVAHRLTTSGGQKVGLAWSPAAPRC